MVYKYVYKPSYNITKKNPSNIFNQKIKGQCTLTTIFFNFSSK